MRATRLLPILLSLFSLLVLAGPLSADDTPTQKAVRQRCDGLVAAVNAHDMKAIKGFIDPSFTMKEGDQTVTYEQTMQMIEELLKSSPDLKQSAKYEKIDGDGDSAKVALALSTSFTDPQGQKQMGTERYLQTWKKLKGRWMLVAEESAGA